MATVHDDRVFGAGLEPVTRKTLAAFRRRRAILLWMRAIGVGLLVFVSLTLLLATVDYLLYFPDAIRWCASVGIYVVTLVAMWAAGVGPWRHGDPLEIARHVESTAPELREHLVAAVELADPKSANGSPQFRRLLQHRVAKRLSKLDVGRLLPLRLVKRWVLSGGAVAVLCLAMMFIPSAQFGRRFARAALPGVAIERASRTRVTIVEPSPPSRYVAERDAVGVIVDVKGASADDVMLHWKSADGSSGETLMTPRVDAAAFLPGQASDVVAETGQRRDSAVAAGLEVESGSESSVEAESAVASGSAEGQRFAANLSVGSQPVHYRITAGDAITLWYELTPLPRPRVTRYEKLYRLPSYAELSDRTADEEHGDLKALQGTTAELTVTFDQPVESPLIRFGVRGARMEMEPADDSSQRFTANISIKTSGQYQIDATSVRSGLNNPFAPTHTITPVLDTPPAIRWGEMVPNSQLVSALDVLELTAVAADDLPLDRVVQEFQVNEGRFQELSIPVDTPDRKLSLAWSWDLLHRLGQEQDTPQLAAGDLIRTRMVAIDRMGTRRESRLIEILIADEGFDADRHDFLDPIARQAERIIEWSGRCETLAESLSNACEQRQFDVLPELKTQWKDLQAESVELVQSITGVLRQTDNAAESSLTQLLGRGLADVETRLDGQLKLVDWLSEQDAEDRSGQRKQPLEELKRDSKRTAYQAERLAELTQAKFTLAINAVLYADVTAIETRLKRLVDEIPSERLPRYILLMAGRLEEINALVKQHEPLLSDRTLQHLSGDNWLRWSQRSAIQLETLVEQNAKRDQAAAVLRSLRDQMKGRAQRVMDTRIHDEVIRWSGELQRDMAYLSDLTREVNEAGKRMQRAEDAAREEKDAKKAAEHLVDARWWKTVWTTRLSRVLVRAALQERLNRAGIKVDLEYAADQKLFQRAMKNVTAEGFQAFKGEPPEQVLDNIAKAIRVLQAASEFTSVRNSLFAIREGERQDDGAPLRKVYHPTWLALQDFAIERGVAALRSAGLDWGTTVARFDGVRGSDDYRLAHTRIDHRRWDDDPMLSAGSAIDGMIRSLESGLTALESERDAARDVLRQYVSKLSEQARQAAETTREAKQHTEQRRESTAEAAEELKPEQQQAVEEATETIQSLIDKANTADIIDEEQRQVARDADAAAELIAEAVRETKESLKAVEGSASEAQRNENLEQSEQAMERLAEQLERTAEHFEKIENGEDLSESREQLRRDEAELRRRNELQQRYEQAEQMANEAMKDPQQLLRELEEELKRNQPMQEALSEISEDIVSEAARNLQQASEQEDALQRQLEKEDAAFAERKRQQQLMLDEFTERAETLRDRTLSVASQAAGWANEPQARERLETARGELNDAIQNAEQVDPYRATLDEIRQAGDQLRDAMTEVSQQLKQTAETLKVAAEKDLHGDDRKRDVTASQMERKANQLRNEELSAIDRQRKSWNSAERDADRRRRTAQKQQRSAEQELERQQKRLDDNPDDEGIKREVDKQRDRLDEAQRTEEQIQQTKQLAEERRRQANERANALNSQRAPSLDQPNPSAELAEQLSRDAAERAQNLAEELGQLNEASDVAAEMRATTESAENLMRQQQPVEDQVRQAASDLERAARHEERLQQQAASEQLREAAEATKQQAVEPAQQATEAVKQLAENGQQASQAGERLQQAAEQIGQQARQIGEMLQSSAAAQNTPQPETQTGTTAMPSPDAMQSPSQQQTQPAQPQQRGQSQQGQPPSGQSPQSAASPAAQSGPTPAEATPAEATPARTGQSMQPQQMAQTLDDLDRALAAQSQAGESTGQQASQPSGQQAGQPQPGQQPSGQQPSGQPSSSQPSSSQSSPGQDASGPASAMDASPTLAQMLEAAMQQAARERMQSLQQAQGGERSGDPSTDAANANPLSESGQGDPPGGIDEIDLLRDAMQDGDWGDLRERGVDDAAQGRGSRVPPGYSREVRAYFRALSKRAAESEE